MNMFFAHTPKQGMGPVNRSKKYQPVYLRTKSKFTGFHHDEHTLKGCCLIGLCLLLMIILIILQYIRTTETTGDTSNEATDWDISNGLTISDKLQDILNVAVVILVTKDPGTSSGFLDSITALSVSIEEANSRHSITKIALVHEDVIHCLPILWYFGFEVISKPIPVRFDEIQNAEYAEKLKNDGCCGPLELLKLCIWTMTDYDYAISMDADMHWHQNFDRIFDVISKGNIRNAKTKNNAEYMGKYLAWTHGATAYRNEELMNGGFLVVRPNVAHYEQMLALVKEGDFREDKSAWKGSHIGWVYGGRTIQGLVPYFYFGVIGKGVADVELDRCTFNVESSLHDYQATICCCFWKWKQIKSEHGGNG